MTRLFASETDPQRTRPGRRPLRGILLLGLLGLVLLGAPLGPGLEVPVARAEPKPTKPAMPPVKELETRLDLREPFNLGRGKVRIVAFLSPTCSHCIANAQGLQTKVLDKMKDADIEVLAVWVKVLEPDNREAIAGAATILHDSRVKHFWDPKRVMNAMLLDAIQFDVQVRMYNCFLLYDRDTAWDKRLPRAPYWMHEYQGAPGPTWNAAQFNTYVGKALAGESLTPLAP